MQQQQEAESAYGAAMRRNSRASTATCEQKARGGWVKKQPFTLNFFKLFTFLFLT